MGTLTPTPTLFPAQHIFPGMDSGLDTRTVIPVTDITLAGVAPPAQTAADPANRNVFTERRGDVFIEVQNTDTAPHTMTVVTPFEQIPDIEIDDVTVTVPAGELRWIGPFPPSVFADQHKVEIDCDSATLMLRAYRLFS